MLRKPCFNERSLVFRLRRAIMGISLAILGFVSMAGAVKAQSAGEHPVGNGDLLRIAVFGDENVARFLSGDFRVSQDGTIKYPVLGSLTVSGKSPDEITRIIRASLGEQAQIAVTPAVSVAEYAPVYLLGSVQRAGSFPYQPDMTVLQLILATGGLPQPADGISRQRLLTQELNELELVDFSLKVERARLLAELHGKDFESRLFPTAQARAKTDILSHEAVKFTVNSRAKDVQTKAYQSQIQTYDLEIESLRQSINLHDEEAKVVKEEMATQQNLFDRGLVPRTRLSEIKREVVVLQRQALEFRTSLYRAQQNRLAAEQKFTETQIYAEKQLLDRLHNLEIDLERTRLKLETTRAMAAGLRAETSAAGSMFGRVPIYTLLRRAGGTYQTTIVDESTKLQRGDILRVDFAINDEAGGGVTSAGQ